MPFDPTIPKARTKFRSAELRNNFNALNDRFDTLPAGPQGEHGDKGDKGDQGAAGDKGDPGDKGDKGDPGDQGDKGDPGEKGDKGDPGDKGDRGDQGDPGTAGGPGEKGDQGVQGLQGPAFAGVLIDATTTLNAGENATVTAFFDGSNARLSFGIPRGFEGATGAQGLQGPAFGSVVVEGVSTLNPGENATVTSSFDGSSVHLTFGLPRGADGSDGGTGERGEKGDKGDPGEVSTQQLTDALAGTARNPVSVPAYTGTFSDPVTQAEMNDYVAWNEARWQSAMR